MPKFQISFKCLSSIAFFIFSITFPIYCQNKVDLEIKVQAASETARGGERFAYKVLVTNKGSAEVADVIVYQTEPKTAVFLTHTSETGKCEIKKYEGNVDRTLECKMNTIQPGESLSVIIEVKIKDFGDSSRGAVPKTTLPEPILDMLKQSNSFLGSISVLSKESEEDRENNSAIIPVELLPSKNAPPRATILTPKNNLLIVSSSNKPAKVKIIIQAFDLDGSIDRVIVNTQQLAGIIFSEGNYIIKGKKYTIAEIEADKILTQKLFGGDAVKTGKDTYTYILEAPQLGSNTISVNVIDNEGRSTESESVEFTVKKR